ncbi:hypothetical protein FSARC_3183 [Fusarium sarcochroum]|uniref:Uncharacterized protein n=1 Tax=Fusarium sarcochroum TaxID=1208366 RepID=A0A8H4XCY4_9HYPO|nr:hypothetical protein FSARC_3183 [Fusarium sarcochroum]
MNSGTETTIENDEMAFLQLPPDTSTTERLLLLWEISLHALNGAVAGYINTIKDAANNEISSTIVENILHDINILSARVSLYANKLEHEMKPANGRSRPQQDMPQDSDAEVADRADENDEDGDKGAIKST